MGEKFPIQELALGDLQGHVDRRAKAKGIRSVRLSPATIKKEIVTLRTSWNWGVHMGLVTGKFPNKGLRYPKQEEKPPFLTWKEIEQRLGAGGLTKKQIAEYWDCLYLMPDEIAALLKFAQETASQPWVYPLFCTAAHTGARRSELLRMQVHDVDFAGETILIHEKKRAHGKLTTRRVSLSPFLKRVLKEWLDGHPGGSMLFAQQAAVARSKTKRSAPTPVTKDEAHDQFKRTLADSKWKVLKGYHCLRHSFISCLASKGIDQRIIDDFVGHQTDEQRRRYRHLFPDVKQKAIASVFGD